MNLKAKVSSGTLYALSGGDCIVSTNANKKDLCQLINKPVVAQRWMEDEKGQRQLISQDLGYFVTDAACGLKPNQEKIADISNGKMIVQYVSRQASYKDNKPDGPCIVFDKEGNVDGVAHYKDGVRDGMCATRQKDGKWRYTLFKKGQPIMEHKELLRVWTERREATKFEKLVKSGGVKGLRATIEEGTKAPVTPTGKER